MTIGERAKLSVSRCFSPIELGSFLPLPHRGYARATPLNRSKTAPALRRSNLAGGRQTSGDNNMDDQDTGRLAMFRDEGWTVAFPES